MKVDEVLLGNKKPVKESFIYPTLQAAQHAIQWTIEN